jgi:hypothetical protein
VNAEEPLCLLGEAPAAGAIAATLPERVREVQCDRTAQGRVLWVLAHDGAGSLRHRERLAGPAEGELLLGEAVEHVGEAGGVGAGLPLENAPGLVERGYRIAVAPGAPERAPELVPRHGHAQVLSAKRAERLRLRQLHALRGDTTGALRWYREAAGR